MMATVEYRGKVRARDVETSWAAAQRQSDVRVDAVKVVILSLLGAYGPTTDETLVDRYEAYAWTHPSIPKVTPQSIRTRRHALKLENKVTDTGRRAPTRAGSTATVWAVADDAAQ